MAVDKDVIKTRVRQLKAMHDLMCCANDEELTMAWLTEGVPDEPMEEDFESIAEDNKSYNACVDLFVELIADDGYRW